MCRPRPAGCDNRHLPRLPVLIFVPVTGPRPVLLSPAGFDTSACRRRMPMHDAVLCLEVGRAGSVSAPCTLASQKDAILSPTWAQIEWAQIFETGGVNRCCHAFVAAGALAPCTVHAHARSMLKLGLLLHEHAYHDQGACWVITMGPSSQFGDGWCGWPHMRQGVLGVCCTGPLCTLALKRRCQGIGGDHQH